ncbi:MAG: Crp/Fnr family transcriptional regulator [Synechococcales bacterium]|nr:Crp/Fnr family transcriptional regulator [Synechococcales bacterium]
MADLRNSPVGFNQLLAALPPDDYEQLAPSLETVSLQMGQVLCEPYEPITHVYFPFQAMISLLAVMEDGTTTEVGVIGNTGILGYPVYLGSNTTCRRAIVQVPGMAVRMRAEVLRTEFEQRAELRRLLLRYTKALIVQISQTAACYRLHSIEQRLARWLAMACDYQQSEELQLTQEFLATMLGTRRASITTAASALQKANLIRYSRGKIVVLDPIGLRLAACECYSAIREEYQRLSPNLEEVARSYRDGHFPPR